MKTYKELIEELNEKYNFSLNKDNYKPEKNTKKATKNNKSINISNNSHPLNPTNPIGLHGPLLNPAHPLHHMFSEEEHK